MCEWKTGEQRAAPWGEELCEHQGTGEQRARASHNQRGGCERNGVEVVAAGGNDIETLAGCL
jgi:hypothetical protein